MSVGSAWRIATGTPTIGNDVHVWRASVAGHARDEPALRALLDANEQQRAARFRFAPDRTRYVVAHGMLRTLLARYTGVAAHAIDVVAGEYGKPAMRVGVRGQAVAFSLSHSADVVLVALAGAGAVGVDVERWIPDIDVEALARDVFSPAERAMLEDLSPLERRAAFFTVWSRKEAYIKATGFGVARGLDHFDVGLAREPAPVTDRLAPDASERWSMRDLGFEPGFSGAVVAEGTGWSLERFVWMGAGGYYGRDRRVGPPG